jgi:hypothetical protein
MKTRVTITLDPAVIRKAKTVARLRKTNLSALIEDLLNQTAKTSTPRHKSFTRKWTGKFQARPTEGNDDLLDAMKKRYGLDD